MPWLGFSFGESCGPSAGAFYTVAPVAIDNTCSSSIRSGVRKRSYNKYNTIKSKPIYCPLSGARYEPGARLTLPGTSLFTLLFVVSHVSVPIILL